MSEKSLAHQEGLNALVRSTLARVSEQAAKCLEGLYKDPKDAGYNPDAEKTWAECSMKTRAALVIHKAANESQGDGKGILGLVFIAGRAPSAKDWEEQARKVDEDERNKAAIDVQVVK